LLLSIPSSIILCNIFVLKGFFSFFINAGSTEFFLLIYIVIISIYVIIIKYKKYFILLILPIIIGYIFMPSFNCETYDTVVSTCQTCICRHDWCDNKQYIEFASNRIVNTNDKNANKVNYLLSFLDVLIYINQTCKTDYCMFLENDYRQLWPWCQSKSIKDIDIIWQDARSVVPRYSLDIYTNVVSLLIKRDRLPFIIDTLFLAFTNNDFRSKNHIHSFQYDTILGKLCKTHFSCDYIPLYVETGAKSLRTQNVKI